MASQHKAEVQPSSEQDDKHATKGFKIIPSVLGAVWNQKEDGMEPEGSSSSHSNDENGNRSQQGKAIDTMGSGNVSLEDFDEDFETVDESDAHPIVPGSNSTPSRHESKLLEVLGSGQSLASPKRNKEFHKLFPKLPSEEILIEDHSCALSRDILVQGRLYISCNHVCFYSNLLGWSISEEIKLSQVVSIHSRNILGVFPNGMTIQTLHHRYTFASLLSRDPVLDLITKLWKSKLNKCGSDAIEEGADGDESSAINTDTDMEDSMYSENEDFDESDNTSSPVKVRQPSRMKWAVPNLGTDTNRPTKLPDPNPGEKILLTETINAPVGVVANLLFGKDTTWYRNFLSEKAENKDVSEIEPFKDDGSGKEKRHYEYIMPLSGPVGPKQTRCKCVETIEEWNLKDYVSVTTATRSPDVPSGNSFVTMSRLAMAWGENNTTLLRTSTWNEWTGKSWIKGAIEKGSLDGQSRYAKLLIKEIEAYLTVGRTRDRRIKIKLPNREESSSVDKPVAPQPAAANMGSVNWMYISAFLGLLVLFQLILLFKSRHVSRLDQRLREVEQEYYLWQWIDNRAPVNLVTSDQLAKIDVKEAIRVAELRLGKLKKALKQ